MRFVAPKIRNLTYVMPGFQQEKLRDQFGRQYGVTPSFRLEFKGTSSKPHEFDSESPAMKATYHQIAKQISSEGREVTVEHLQKRVEDYLLTHPDHGRTFNAVLSDAPQAVPITGPICSAKIMDGDAPRSCPQPAAVGSDYCAAHRDEIAQREAHHQPAIV